MLLDFVPMVPLVNICSKWIFKFSFTWSFVEILHIYTGLLISLFHSPRFELPASDVGQKDTKKLVVICHFCGDTKHKAMYCDKVSNDIKDQMNAEEIAVSILLIFGSFLLWLHELFVSNSCVAEISSAFPFFTIHLKIFLFVH